MTFWLIEIALAWVPLSSPSPFHSCGKIAPRKLATAEQVGEEGAVAFYRMKIDFWIWGTPEQENQNMGSDSAKQLTMCFKSKPFLIPLTPMGFKQRLKT